MPYTNYEGTIKCFDGFGVAEIAVASGYVASMIINDRGEAPPEGSVLQIYQGSYQLTELISSNVIYRKPFGPEYWYFESTYTSVTGPFTMALRLPKKVRRDFGYVVCISS